MEHNCYTCRHDSVDQYDDPCRTCIANEVKFSMWQAPLEPAETRILSRLSARLSQGRADYGPLDVHDGRDWLEEAIQEAADLLIYLECIKEQRDGEK